MKIAVLGITGRAGSRIAAELLGRGHEVTGVARNIGQVAAQPGLAVVAGDMADLPALAGAVRGHDAIVSATRFVDGIKADGLIALAREAGVGRVLVVGGAGSLEVAPGALLIDAPDFPAAYKAEAGAGKVFLDELKAGAGELDWVFLSPSAEFAPGERKGRFRLGCDSLLVDVDGRSWISMEDYAIAVADEIERPRHSRQRFTVGY